MRKLAIYPGTFDPITNGHLDIISRSAELFDKVVIAIAKSETKKPMFSEQERLEMVMKATENFRNVKCTGFDGLLASLAKSMDVRVIIRGLRVVSDFEYELQMGYANASLNPDLETIYFMPTLQNAFISSSIVRSVILHDGEFSHLVPRQVKNYILKRRSKRELSCKLEEVKCR